MRMKGPWICTVGLGINLHTFVPGVLRSRVKTAAQSTVAVKCCQSCAAFDRENRVGCRCSKIAARQMLQAKVFLKMLGRVDVSDTWSAPCRILMKPCDACLQMSGFFDLEPFGLMCVYVFLSHIDS